MAHRGALGVTWNAQRPGDGATEDMVGILGDYTEWDFMLIQELAIRNEDGDIKPRCEDWQDGHMLVRNLRRPGDTALSIHRRWASAGWHFRDRLRRVGHGEGERRQADDHWLPSPPRGMAPQRREFPERLRGHLGDPRGDESGGERHAARLRSRRKPQHPGLRRRELSGSRSSCDGDIAKRGLGSLRQEAASGRRRASGTPTPPRRRGP